MESDEIVRCLIAGGVSEAVLRATVADDHDAIPRYDGLRDLLGCSALAKELATRLSPSAADAIVIGPSVEEAVLAAFTARELGINVVRSYIDEGLLFAPQLRANMRLILLSDVFRTWSALNAMWSLATERGSQVCAVGALYELTPAVLPNPGVKRAVLLSAGASVLP